MNIIFLGIVIWNILFFVITLVTGMMGWKVWHFSFGVLTGILTCFTHSLVFIQLIGSGKGIKEALEGYGIPDDPKTGFTFRAKAFKTRAFSYAMFVPMLTIVTVWLGGWHDTNPLDQRELSHWVHMLSAWLTVGINLFAFKVEYDVIAENSAMIRELNQLIQSKPPKEALPPQSPSANA